MFLVCIDEKYTEKAYELADALEKLNYKMEYIYLYDREGSEKVKRSRVIKIDSEKFRKFKKADIIIREIEQNGMLYGLSGIYGATHHVMVANKEEIVEYIKVYGKQVIPVTFDGDTIDDGVGLRLIQNVDSKILANMIDEYIKEIKLVG